MTSPEEATENGPSFPEDTRPGGYYALLIGAYQALFGGFIVLYRNKSNRLEQITPLDFVLLGLATLRVSKVISEDEITEVVRTPLVERRGGGKQPRGHGFRWALGRLVLCPTCTGTWVAAFLGYSLHLFPRYTRPFLAIMSASGFEQFTDALLSLVYADRDVLREK